MLDFWKHRRAELLVGAQSQTCVTLVLLDKTFRRTKPPGRSKKAEVFVLIQGHDVGVIVHPEFSPPQGLPPDVPDQVHEARALPGRDEQPGECPPAGARGQGPRGHLVRQLG